MSATINLRDRPLKWLMSFAQGERLQLIEMLLDRGCVTYGDVIDTIDRGEIDEATLRRIVEVDDFGSGMPPMFVCTAMLKLEGF